jgi:thermitase
MSVEGWMLQFAGTKTRDEVSVAVGAVLQARGVLARLAEAPEKLNADGTAWSLPASAETAALTEPESWDLAYALRDNIPDLVSAEPIVLVPGMGDDVDAVPDPRAFGGFSRGDHIPESDPIDWALEKLNVRQAWATLTQMFPGQRPGEGTIVGHPDTGYTEHPELITNLALDLQRGRNFKDSGQTVPVDPLTGRAAGHGTATATVMVSAGATQIHPGVLGVAPGVSLAPLRVHDSVVHFSWSNLTKALYHAADSGCHVVSMSLGGGWGGDSLRAAVRYATQRGVILISAAGNHTPYVIYPAAYPEVIAMAASNARDGLWSGSALGKAVAATAPGESVWRGKSDTSRSGQPAFEVARSSGTSYATALTAGACALWLQRHGRATLLARYGAGLGGAFRSVLQSSIRKVPGWPKNKAGPGIVDVGALIRAALPSTVPAPQPMAAAAVHPRIDAIAAIGGWSQSEAERWAADKLNAAPTALTGRLDEVGAELSLVLLRSRLSTSTAPAPVALAGNGAPVASARLRQLAPGL